MFPRVCIFFIINCRCVKNWKRNDVFFSGSFSPTDFCQNGSPGLYNILCFSVFYACYIIQLLDWWIMRLWITWCSVFIWWLHLRFFFGRNAEAACFSTKKPKSTCWNRHGRMTLPTVRNTWKFCNGWGQVGKGSN